MRSWTFLSILSLALVVAGCKDEPPAPKHDPAAHDHSKHDHSQHEQAAAPEKSDEPAGPKIETGSFMLAVAPAQPTYSAGKPGELQIARELPDIRDTNWSIDDVRR